MTLYIKSLGSWSAQNLYLGRVGENKYRTVEIDASAFAADWPDCTFSLIYRRPDELAYPAVIATSGAVITWAITAADVAVDGEGSLELRLISGDVIGKSDALPCTVTKAITGEGETPAAPAPDWLNIVTQGITTIQTAADNFTDVTIPAAEETIAAKADTEIIRVGEAGTTQITLATEQADRAADEADDAAESAEIAANNLLNGVSVHNQDNTSHPDIREEIDRAEAIARGRAVSLVFATVTQLDEWIAGTYVRNDGLTTADLQVGDNLYIIDVNVPDYWWDGSTKQKLEAEAPELADYYTKLQVQMLLPILITRADYDALYAAGTIQADRLYDIIEATE